MGFRFKPPEITRKVRLPRDAFVPYASQDRHRPAARLSGAKAEIPELASVKHVFVKAAARLNNRAENSHQPTRERERRMRGFRDPKRTQEFLLCFGPIRQHFALKRHLLHASPYRKQLAARFVDWRKITQLAQDPSTGF
jgi:putative transposase